MSSLVRAAFLFIVFLTPAFASGATETAGAYDDHARFLAGMPVSESSPLHAWTEEGSWRQHRQQLDAAWSRLERSRLAPARIWAKENLKSHSPTLLYTFSGPDYLYANVFFPNALTYVMAGLEPVGAIPKVAARNRHAVGELRLSLRTILNYSFFRTKDMRREFASNNFSGVVPVLFMFLARAGKSLRDVELLRVGPDGNLIAAGDEAHPGHPQAVRIRFAGEDGIERSLIYVQVDVSNSGRQRDAFVELARRQGEVDVFLKSASYLMHVDSFSKIRSHLLEHARLVLQDDSGIPLRFFDHKDWELTPLGRYAGPIGLFSQHYQSDLAALHRSAKSQPLSFGIGYRIHPGESSLLLAIRKPQ